MSPCGQTAHCALRNSTIDEPSRVSSLSVFPVRLGTSSVHITDSSMPCMICSLSRSEEHTSELQSLMRISYAVFCLKKKKNTTLAKLNITIMKRHLTTNYKTHNQH